MGPVVVTEKLDGENSTLYRDGMHARSVDGRHHASRDWLKRAHAAIAWQIPEGWRVCGENMFARHSIPYAELASYFYVFSVWDGPVCLGWEDTVDWAERLGFPVPRVLYRGPFEETALRQLAIDTTVCEGWVARPEGPFHLDAFPLRVAKWVRAGHVQTDQHWAHAPIVPNGLR